MKKIEIITCESGDWEILKVDGEEVASGHSLSNQDWIDMLYEHFNMNVVETEISDEDMEMLS